MTPYIVEAADRLAGTATAFQESWDRQQEAFLPDREERLAAMLDAVDAITDGDAPRLLDLAGAPAPSPCGRWPVSPGPR